MAIYEIRFHRKRILSRWISNKCSSKNDAMTWFKQMLVENYSLSEKEVNDICMKACFIDVTSSTPTTAQTLHIPKSKMFNF